MLRKTGAIAAIMLLVGAFIAVPAIAGVQKVVVCEDFGADW